MSVIGKLQVSPVCDRLKMDCSSLDKILDFLNKCGCDSCKEDIVWIFEHDEN